MPSFQVSSIITTTGYTTADYSAWPVFSQTILVMIMFVGAMAGSTGGGIKISRVAILFKNARARPALDAVPPQRAHPQI